jgi:signal transduction histidine kinase
LSIVNRIAQASGGRLSIETRLGYGSTFILHLTLAGPPGPEPTAV